MRVWRLTDPDLPAELHHIRDIFLPPPTPKAEGYQQFRQAAEQLRQRIQQKSETKKQLPLTLYGNDDA